MDTRSNKDSATHITKKDLILQRISLRLIVSILTTIMVALLASGCTSLQTGDQSPDNVTGEPENGNSAFSLSWMTRMNESTYILYWPGTLTEIPDSPSAEPRIINYQPLSDTESTEGGRSFSSGSKVVCAYDDRLYLLRFYQDANVSEVIYNNISEALSVIDPTQDEPAEQRIAINWDAESSAYLLEETEFKEALDLNEPFEWLLPIEQLDQYVYFLVSEEGKLTQKGVPEKTIIVRLDLSTGTLSVISDYDSSKTYRNNYMLSQAYLYYTAHEDNVTNGLYRAPIEDLAAEELVFEMLESDFETHYAMVVNVVEGRVYYYEATRLYSRMLCYDPKARRTTVVVDEFDATQPYNIIGDTFYYIDEEGNLNSVDHDGQNHTLLIKGQPAGTLSPGKKHLTVSGDWLYYREAAGFYRVLPEAEQFPTKSVFSMFAYLDLDGL